MAAEVFNCELSKISDLFFTSREEVSGSVGEAKPPKKEIQSSPLPRDHEDDDDDDDEEED